MRLRKPKIGIALGSGGPKGLAHIGVIKVLNENNISIDFIAGSSIGALIGGFYAATGDIEQIKKTALNTNWRQILTLIDPSFRQGLLSGQKIKKFIEDYIGKIEFQDLKIPLSVIATDLKTGEAVSINKGEVASAIRASISFPLVFKPIEYKGRILTDGGLSLPVPVKTVKEMGAELIIAVNLDADYPAYNLKVNNFGFYKIANNSINLLRHHLANWVVCGADIIVNPSLSNVHWNKFLNGREVIFAGEDAMKEMLPALKELIYKKIN